MKIGELRLIPKGKALFSIALQENIKIEKDVVVEITNTLIDNSEFFFGKIKDISNSIHFVSSRDRQNGDILVEYLVTEHYEMPKPQISLA